MTVTTYPDRAAWEAGRAERNRDRVGASEVAAVLGISPYAGPWDVWARRHAVELVPRQTSAMAAGLRWEKAIIDAVVDLRALDVIDASGLAVYDDGVVTATPDAVCLDSDGYRVVVEAKATAYSAHGASLWEDGGIVSPGWAEGGASRPPAPPWYIAQVQAQLACSGASYGLLAAFFGPFDLRVVRVEFDPEWWAEAREACEWFRDWNLVGCDEHGFTTGRPVPPDRDASDASVRWSLLQAHQAAGEVDAEGADAELVADVIEASARCDAENERKKGLRAALAERMQDLGARRLRCAAGTATVSKAGVLSVRPAKETT